MPLVRGRKESKLVRSLVLYIKLGVRFSRRLAARVPSFKLHIPCIRTLRMSKDLPIQELNDVHPKLDVPPLSLSGFSPATQLGAILYKIIRRSRGRQSALA